jgi:hypothetical protein
MEVHSISCARGCAISACGREAARDVASVARFAEEIGAKIVHRAEEGSQFAPGYYSVLFEDPEGIRIEVNYAPGKGTAA